MKGLNRFSSFFWVVFRRRSPLVFYLFLKKGRQTRHKIAEILQSANWMNRAKWKLADESQRVSARNSLMIGRKYSGEIAE